MRASSQRAPAQRAACPWRQARTRQRDEQYCVPHRAHEVFLRSLVFCPQVRHVTITGGKSCARIYRYSWTFNKERIFPLFSFGAPLDARGPVGRARVARGLEKKEAPGASNGLGKWAKNSICLRSLLAAPASAKQSKISLVS